MPVKDKKNKIESSDKKMSLSHILNILESFLNGKIRKLPSSLFRHHDWLTFLVSFIVKLSLLYSRAVLRPIS